MSGMFGPGGHRGPIPGRVPDALAGMDPLQRARYDSAVQRYHDTVAAHRATFDAEMRKAKDAVDELHRRHTPSREAGERGRDDGGEPERETEAGMSRVRRRIPAVSGPVQSILNRGG